MAEPNKVVAHFEDGSLLKGTTSDFNVAKPSFHLNPLTGAPGVEVFCRSLKALFFVKDLKGGGSRSPAVKGFEGSTSPGGKKIAVHFHDGELLCGFTLSYIPGREGFFMFPAESDSNNLRIFVANANVQEVCVGTDADDLVRRIQLERRTAAMKV
jgi:hypothetical protein